MLANVVPRKNGKSDQNEALCEMTPELIYGKYLDQVLKDNPKLKTNPINIFCFLFQCWLLPLSRQCF